MGSRLPVPVVATAYIASTFKLDPNFSHSSRRNRGTVQ